MRCELTANNRVLAGFVGHEIGRLIDVADKYFLDGRSLHSSNMERANFAAALDKGSNLHLVRVATARANAPPLGTGEPYLRFGSGVRLSCSCLSPMTALSEKDMLLS